MRAAIAAENPSLAVAFIGGPHLPMSDPLPPASQDSLPSSAGPPPDGAHDAAPDAGQDAVQEGVRESMQEGAQEAERAREAQAAEEREARLRALLARLSASPDFPSLRESVRAIQKVSRNERAHLRALSDEILQDFSLSGKLLRLVNAAFYRSAGGAEVDSVSRAVAIMGVDAIGRLAASLKLFDRLPPAMQGTRVQAEFARALLAALAAHELHPSVKEGETVYLAGLFQNLGRLLIWMHFPLEAQQVEQAVARELERGAAPEEDGALRQSRRAALEARQASQQFGLSYPEIGVEVARLWGWPASMLRALQPMAPEDYQGPRPGDDRVRLVASLANQLADVVTDTPPEALVGALVGFQARWKNFLGEDPKPFQALLGRVERQWSELAAVTHVAEAGAGRPRPARAAAPGTAATPSKGAAPAWPAFAVAGVLRRQSALPRMATATEPGASRRGPRGGVAPEEAHAALARGTQRLAQSLAEGCSAAAALKLVMEVLLQALGAQRVVVCLREPATGWLQGRLGEGAGMPRLLTHFYIDPGAPNDLFGLACSRNLDTVIDDATKPATWRALPQWFRMHLGVRCLLVLPLMGEKGCIGLIYADHPEAGGLPVQGEQLRQVQALRDQVQALLLRRPAPAQTLPSAA